MKKLLAVFLTLALVFAMGTMAFAEDGNNEETGTITISNAIQGAEYKIYKMLTFEPVSGSATQGRYTVVAGWEGFLSGAGAAYLRVDEEINTIKWVGEESDVRKSELAKAAIAYAKNNSIAATATQTAAANGAVTFADVSLGYYAIDTSLGTVCGLTNVDNTFEAHEKNEKPDIDKYVQEDSTQGWGKVNDADIDQVVNFKSTITVGYGVTNYVMHDTMEAGLTFNNNSVVVKLADGTVVDAANYTVVYPATDGHTFDVQFKNEFIATLAKGTQITVYYSATLNENANIVTDGNDNTVYLSYGEDSTWETNEHKTTTYTWKLDVLKFTKDGDKKVSLAGAKFQLLANDGTAIKFTQVGAAVPTYKVDANGAIDTITTDANGKFEIVGLDEGAYKLHEVEAPVGYNKLASDLDVVITSTYDETALTASYKINAKDPATIEVENKTGSLIPETGSFGSTLFYSVGGVLMTVTAVLLVSKKRMADIDL